MSRSAQPPSGSAQPPSGSAQPPSGSVQPPSRSAQPPSGSVQPSFGSTSESLEEWRQIRHEQDVAFQESLQADREKARKKAAEEQRQQVELTCHSYSTKLLTDTHILGT